VVFIERFAAYEPLVIKGNIQIVAGYVIDRIQVSTSRAGSSNINESMRRPHKFRIVTMNEMRCRVHS